MATTVKIILVQSKDDRGLQYRIAKLVGSVHVQTRANKEYHVGDWIDEKTATELAQTRAYEVTVTERGGKQ